MARVPIDQVLPGEGSEAPKKTRMSIDDAVAQEQSKAPDKKGFVQQVAESTRDAGIEALRGFELQGADMVDSADATVQILAKLVGLGEVNTGLKNVSGSIRQATEEFIPETNLPENVKNVYQTVGRLPGMAAEFVATRKALTSAVDPFTKSFGKLKAPSDLTDSVAAGVQQAVAEYKNSPEFESLARGFMEGSTLGMLFSLTPKAIELAKAGGKFAAFNFIKAVTGDEATAAAFVKDPMKFSLNPFKKTPNVSEITENNAAVIDDLKQNYASRLADERIVISEKKSILSSEMDRNFYALKDKNREIVNAVQGKARTDIDAISKTASETYAKTVDSIKTGLLDDFSNSVRKLELIREAKGAQVGQAVDNIISKDPFSRIDSKGYLNRFKKVADDNGFEVRFTATEIPPSAGDLMNTAPAQIMNKPTVVPKFGAGASDEGVQKLLQDNLDDIMQVASSDGIPLGFAQGKKRLLQQAGYSGQGLTANVQKQLSGALNPAGMDDLIIGNNIKPELAMLKSSNKEFSELVPRYEEALKNYARPDASGQAVPDFTKALNAVLRDDKATIRQLMKADAALMPEDRLLPKVRDAAERMSRADSIQTANVKLAKRKAGERVRDLQREIREKEFKLRVSQRQNRQAESRRLQTELNRLRTSEKMKLDETVERLKREETFLKQQAALRSFFGKGRAGNVQTAGFLGLATQVSHPNSLVGTTSAALTAIPSPLVVANAIKTLSRLTGGPMDAVSRGIRGIQSITKKI